MHPRQPFGPFGGPQSSQGGLWGGMWQTAVPNPEFFVQQQPGPPGVPMHHPQHHPHQAPHAAQQQFGPYAPHPHQQQTGHHAPPHPNFMPVGVRNPMLPSQIPHAALQQMLQQQQQQLQQQTSLPTVVPPPVVASSPPIPPVAPVAIPQITVPYYDLPAGLMVPMVPVEETSYTPLKPDEMKLPAPAPPSEKLLKAVEQFYQPASRDRPRNSEGWEQLALYEFQKEKAKHRDHYNNDSNKRKYNEL